MRDTLKKKRNETGAEEKWEEGRRGEEEGVYGFDYRVQRVSKKKKEKSPRESGLYTNRVSTAFIHIPSSVSPESNKSLSYLRQGN